MSQSYKGNTKRPKLKQNQLGILRIYAFCQKIQQRAGESTAAVPIFVWEYNWKVAACSPPKLAITLFSVSWKGTVGASQSHS